MTRSPESYVPDNFETHGFPRSVFFPPNSFDEKQQVVLGAYLVNKLRTQGTINAIDDAYQTALNEIHDNPDILREMYVELMQKLAAHVAGAGTKVTTEVQDFTGIDREVLEACESTLRHTNTQDSFLQDLGVIPHNP